MLVDFVQGFDFGDVYNPYRPRSSTQHIENGYEYWVFSENSAEFMDDEKKFRADTLLISII